MQESHKEVTGLQKITVTLFGWLRFLMACLALGDTCLRRSDGKEVILHQSAIANRSIRNRKASLL